jgi:ABC-type phosphate transport system auxiliary subunit
MKGATLADAAIMNTDVLYEQIEQLRDENRKLQIENQLLQAFYSKGKEQEL